MKKMLAFLLLAGFSVFFILGASGCKKESNRGGVTDPSAVPWVTIDEFYIPLDYVEEFIKEDSTQKGLLPVQIKNYGSSSEILRKFRGTNFAGPTEAQLKMMYEGLGEWKLVDLKYKNEKDRDVQRTLLYVYVNGSWMLGDSGTLVE